MQEVDAERRIQILRGLRADAPPLQSIAEETEKDLRNGQDEPRRERKRRRIGGEDDTERDIRYAQEASAAIPAKLDLQLKTPKSSDAPLTDSKGHINLFPIEGSRQNVAKNTEAEAESAKKKKEFEDQYIMRFSNAAGFKQAVGQKPWYHSMGAEREEEEAPSKDVWGNDDPRKKEREKIRLAVDDPLAIIKEGVTGLREVERERNRWKEERDREKRDMVYFEEQKKGRKRRHEEDALNGFSLDAPLIDEHHRHRMDPSKEPNSRHRHRHPHRDRSHSRDRCRHHSHRHRHHHTSRHEAGISKKHNERHHVDHEQSIEELRKKRDKREEAEDARVAKLLARASAKNRPGWEKRPGGRYSVQFGLVEISSPQVEPPYSTSLKNCRTHSATF